MEDSRKREELERFLEVLEKLNCGGAGIDGMKEQLREIRFCERRFLKIYWEINGKHIINYERGFDIEV